MKEILGDLEPFGRPLPAALSFIIESKFVMRHGCYVLDALLDASHCDRRSFPDEIGYECAVNSIHIDDYAVCKEQISLGLLVIACLKEMWRESPFVDGRLQFILAANTTCCVLKFHVIRPGQRLLMDNLDGYANDAILVAT